MITKLVNYCVITFILLIAMSVQAAAPMAEIQALLAQPDVLCGRFDQTKYLVSIKKPLISTGRFCVVANKGALWQTLKPFPNTLRLTRDAIVQMQGNRVAIQLDANKEPVVKMINSVLFSLLVGDLSQLQKLFEINGSLQNHTWQVTLNAREPQLAKAIGRITLAGNKYVKKVLMNEENGDHTVINFSALNSGATTITAEERAQLEH